MSEKGSDERLYEIATSQEVTAGVVDDAEALAEEEERVLSSDPAEDEPGEQHPDPDEAPPADQPHPEYDPTGESNGRTTSQD